MLTQTALLPPKVCCATYLVKGKASSAGYRGKRWERIKAHDTGVKAANGVLITEKELPKLDASVDDSLSWRPLQLDAEGYFLVKLDRSTREIIAEHYTNTIDKDGVACDPETGKPIPCTAGYVRQPRKVYRGRTAKELSVKIIEQEAPPPIAHLEHANYLGREFQRAELAMITGNLYVQD